MAPFFVAKGPRVFQPRQIEKFHKEAAAALATGTSRFHAQRRFRNLAAEFQEHKNDPLFLELIVMAGLFARLRHYLILRTLRRLRKIRIKQKQPELFEAFERQLASNRSGVSINNHGYGARTLADVDTETFYDALRHLIADLGDMGFECSMNSGTLLGLTREKGLLAFDDDVDLFVLLDADDHAEAAKTFHTLALQLFDAGHENALLLIHDGIIKLQRIDGFKVDLFPAYQLGGQFFIYPYAFGELAIHDVLPLVNCPVSHLPIPQSAHRVLEVNYGKNVGRTGSTLLVSLEATEKEVCRNFEWARKPCRMT